MTRDTIVGLGCAAALIFVAGLEVGRRAVSVVVSVEPAACAPVPSDQVCACVQPPKKRKSA
jgi:hypothetical protein